MLDSFHTEEEALRYIKKNKLNIIKYTEESGL